MQRPSFELPKGLEKNGDEGVYVLRCIFRRLDNFAIVGIRETNADSVGDYLDWDDGLRDKFLRLVQEEYVRYFIPTEGIPERTISRLVGHIDAAWSYILISG